MAALRGAQSTPTAPTASIAQRSAPFSVHSRGVQLLERSRVLDVSQQLSSLGRQLRDISVSFWVLVTIQPWLTWIALAVTLGSVSCVIPHDPGRVDWHPCAR